MSHRPDPRADSLALSLSFKSPRVQRAFTFLRRFLISFPGCFFRAHKARAPLRFSVFRRVVCCLALKLFANPAKLRYARFPRFPSRSAAFAAASTYPDRRRKGIPSKRSRMIARILLHSPVLHPAGGGCGTLMRSRVSDECLRFQ